jgi:Domain of unknown function (DUF4395)
MGSTAEVHFVRQQGFVDASAEACGRTYPALLFQPRVIGSLVVIGLALRSAPLFLALSAVLWWSVGLPRINPFDAIYNALVARPRSRPLLGPAPAPRRFAQGMAASFMLAIGVSILYRWDAARWILEGLLVAALVALNFGKLCVGSYVFHLLRGRAAFANATLPWTREG